MNYFRLCSRDLHGTLPCYKTQNSTATKHTPTYHRTQMPLQSCVEAAETQKLKKNKTNKLLSLHFFKGRIKITADVKDPVKRICENISQSAAHDVILWLHVALPLLSPSSPLSVFLLPFYSFAQSLRLLLK